MALPTLEGYEIKQEFAAGGMAKIYEAIQISLNRAVAIKFLSKQLLSHSEAHALFERESLIIARLNHPNIVQIIDKGVTQESQPYFVMEKIEGIDLSKILNQGDLPKNKKFDIALQLCKGLGYAHKNGVIHRDIKPSNIIVNQHGDVKILDFGIALAGKNPLKSNQPSSVVGTTGYVAPEQQSDYGNATIASDIYSVGIVFRDLFFASDENNQSRDDINQTFSQIKSLIDKCCHQNPDKRYASLANVRDELLRISQGSHLSQSHIQTVQKENKDLTSDFNLLDVLSQSASKRVYLFQKKSTKQLIVIRRSFGDHAGLKEAKILSSFKHPNIVNIYAAVKAQANSTIISEYLSGGSLINQLAQELTEQDFLKLALKISSAIDYAHQHNVLHSNLSPNNILFDDRQNLKICDFGQANNSNDDPIAAKAYQPPSQQAFGKVFDIYCMGAIFHRMLFSVPPNTALPAKVRTTSFRLQKLLDRMLSIDPSNRPSSAQEVFVELQRISHNNENTRRRSKLGMASEDSIEVKKRKVKILSPPKQASSPWIWTALMISLLANIGLTIKLFN